MQANLKNVLGATLLVSMALLSWLWSREGSQDEAPEAPTRSGPLGYYLSDAEILGTDESGRPLYRIWAGSAEERPGERRLVLSDVTVQYQPENDIPWVLKAARGEVPTNESYLDLSGEVELATGPQEGAGPTIIRTVQLRLQPESFVAETAAPVSVFIGERRLDAVGMRADLKADQLALESNVHGQFRP